MAKQTRWHYVLVLTNHGPVFVTKIGEHKTAYWNDSEKPKEFSKEWAEDLAFGLTVNGYCAFAVTTRYELDNQPYRYNMGQFEWISKEEEDGTTED